MKISKSIILPEFESIESLEQAGDILHKITEAMKDHQIQNYDDAIANYRRVTTGRIQSQDGETYFDLDSGVIKGEIVFRKGSSGLSNIEEASPGDWDNAFRLASAVCGDSDFTLISGGKIITSSVAVGAFNSDVVARIFGSGTNKTNIEAWMKSGAITYIDGAKIYTGSITATQIEALTITGAEIAAATITGAKIAANTITATQIAATTITAAEIATNAITSVKINANAVTAGKINVTNLAAVSAILGSVSAGNIQGTRLQIGGGTNEDIYFEDSGIRLYDAGSRSLRFSKLGYSSFDIGLNSDNNKIYSSGYMVIGASAKNYLFHTTGALQLPALGSDPSSNLAAGQLAIVNNVLRIYNGSSWSNV